MLSAPVDYSQELSVHLDTLHDTIEPYTNEEVDPWHTVS